MTINYRDTLNLPETELSMKAGLPRKEPEIIEFWNDIDVYKKLRELHENDETFILHDGPPYANGSIHLGHSVNKILKDITIKSKTFLGKNAPYVPGWDCHGLPIELNIEKKHGKRSELVQDKKSFQEACKEYALTQIENQKKDFIRLGVFGEWDKPYKSLDSTFEADAIRALGKIYEADHLQKGEKPVHWCQDCGSALAEAEVEYQDKVSKSIDVAFKVDEQSIDSVKTVFGFSENESISFVIWTTTPWTIPSNVAVCINPDLEYTLIKIDNSHYIIADSMIESCSDRWGIEVKKISTVKGHELEDIDLIHPFIDRKSKLLHADHVTTDAGTGCVHTAPAHGMDDFSICKKNNIQIIKALDSKGLFKEEIDFIAGLPPLKADPLVIEKIDEKGALINCDDYHHSYPHCWRHKTPLIFTSTPQWFISMDKGGLLKNALGSINEVKWEPSWGLQRIESMLTDRPDWCISRQRFWGVPIPLFIHKETNQLHKDTSKILNKAADIISEKNIEGWFDYDKKTLIDDHEKYFMITDTLDVWFDSGVSHISVIQERGLGDTADLYLEGSDQHRGWFQSSLITGLAIKNKPPYKNVLTHGFVVDAEGQKMSKSQGNVIAPQTVIKSKGSDILRLWVATTDYTKEMHISEEILKRASEGYRRIRNTIKFLISNTADYSGETHEGQYNLTILDKWILNETNQLQSSIKKNYEDFKFHQIVQDIQNFCSVHLGGYYLDIIKDRLYTSKVDGDARKASQFVCHKILTMMNVWIAPILSFTAEEVYQSMKDKKHESIFLEEWSSENFHIDEQEKSIGDSLFYLKQLVAKKLDEARNNEIIGSSLDASLQLSVNKKIYNSLKKYEDELKFIFITSACKLILQEEPEEEINIKVERNDHLKCDRCWHKHESVGSIEGHEAICTRCHSNIYADGEKRYLG